MSSDPWSDELRVEASRPVKAPPSTSRVWLERIGIGIIAVISILIPLIVGLLFYLVLAGDVVINANDPMHQTRLWLVQERTGVTGVGLTVTALRETTATIQCTTNSVTFLKWDRRLRIERDTTYCACYEIKNGKFLERGSVSCTP
jgi:hypothetical protein